MSLNVQKNNHINLYQMCLWSLNRMVKVRVILDLSRFNEAVHKPLFKMDNIHTATNMIIPGVYMSSIGLQDAYFTFPICLESTSKSHSNSPDLSLIWYRLPFTINLYDNDTKMKKEKTFSRSLPIFSLMAKSLIFFIFSFSIKFIFFFQIIPFCFHSLLHYLKFNIFFPFPLLPLPPLTTAS